jgi:hypothetical protein
MFKTKIIAATLAVATLAGSLGATTGTAEAGSRGAAIGLGIAAGALIGAAATSHAYSGPSYVVDHGYRRCKWVRQYDGYGYYVGTTKVCRY